MAQVNRPKFTSTIINADWAAARRAENGSQTVRINTVAASHPAPARSTALLARPVMTTTAIVSRDWAPSGTVVVEAVDLPESLDPRLTVLRDPTSVQARSYRLLQHRLAVQGNPRVVAVTSAKRGEGKTTCATNLALTLAEASSARVLLIEASLARPELGHLFGFEPNSFMEHLVQRLDSAPPYPVAAVCGSRLQVAALKSTPHHSFRLDGRLLQTAIRSLRHCYDHIIIDAPSVLESADVDAVGASVDGFVIAARVGKSSKSHLRSAVSQLYPAKVFGVVLLDS